MSASDDFTPVHALHRAEGWLDLAHSPAASHRQRPRVFDQVRQRRRGAGHLVGALDGRAQGEPRLLKFRAGRRAQAWKRNCIAIGLASGFLEPLESTSMFLVQKAIQDMLRLLPTPEARGVDERLVSEFNRLSDALYERIRDFLILHYTANRRIGEPLWDHVRDYELPDSLRHKLRLFDARGHVPYFKDGFFSRDSWLAVLFGQGLTPRAHDRLADCLSPELLDAKLRELHGRVSSHALNMPLHADMIARYCGEPQRVKQAMSS